MSRIFISYRRDDSGGYVLSLRSLLIQRFGADEIFRDIETIPPGVDFVEAIEVAVGSCEVLLAVIGPRWLTTTDRPGQRRLDNPEDFVRIEIATALERNIRVIPVLVQDAHMPRSNELPATLARLARRNAIELRDSSWEYDVGRLGDALETILQSQTQVNQVVQPPVQQSQVSLVDQHDAFIAAGNQIFLGTAQQPQPTEQIDALIIRLLEAEQREDWDTVIAVGEQILQLSPNHESARIKTAEGYLNCGLAAYNHGNPEKAMAGYTQAIKLNPSLASAYYLRGLFRFDRGDLNGALSDYTQAIMLGLKHAEVYNNRGNILSKQGNFLDAIADYNQAIELDPNLAVAYHNRGLAFLTFKSRWAARNDFERAAQLGHEDAKKQLAEL